jgi:hypothetical protein
MGNLPLTYIKVDKMNRNMALYPLILSVIICVPVNGTVHANSNDKPQPYEEIYSEIGYETVEEAAKEFEHHFQQSLKLPLRVPPISFTHHFGRFNDLEGDLNDSFEVEFISDKSPENHYKIDVRPLKSKIPIRDKDVLGVYKLKNKNEAILMNISSYNVLVFERDNWQYMLSLDKRVSEKVNSEILVEIANSIDYGKPKK